MRWVLMLALGLGCRSSPSARDEPAPATAAVPVREMPDGSVRLDCASDAECGALVCHDDVMGGTCGPRCESDDVCTGVDATLRCHDGHCVFPADGGAR